ncbi:hypothetical protein J7L70_05620 [Candidatus Bathyarchaeota archaeon]|nr:hypothetical protein [Candidatus Bathyarchaeota archaeon]
MRMLKPLSVVMVMLLLGSITTAIPVTLADQQESSTSEEELRYKAEAMIQLLNQTVERVNATLEFLNETLGGIPPEAYDRYQRALELYENATQLFAEGNYTEAIRLSFKALQVFKLCLKTAVGVEAEEAEACRRLEAALRRLNMSIRRVERARDMLLRVFPSLENNVTEVVDPLISEAKQLAEEACQALEDGNVTKAAALTGEAHAKIANALAAINRLVNSKIVMALRIKHYIVVCFAGFSARVKRRAGLLGLSLDDVLKEVKEELGEAEGLIAEGHLKLAKAKIVCVKAKIQGILHQLEKHHRGHHDEHSNAKGKHGRP